jgi:hypothetical protein
MGREFKVPLSTLKLNARILKKLGLIDFGGGSVARLTKAGKLVLSLLFEKAH